jgi:spore maturation protein CgeB
MKETVLLLTPLEDCSKHRLSKHVGQYLVVTTRFDLYFYEPLKKIFSNVVVYDYMKRLTEIGPNAVNKEVVELVRKEHPQYVLWLSAFYEFRESTFMAIRKEAVVVIGWFSDDEWRFDDYSKWWIPYLDYCVTNDINTVPKYRELGARAIQAYYTGIAVDRDWSEIHEKYDVSFVGRKYSDREQYINELMKRNIKVYVVGKEWDGAKYASFEEMIDIFATSKINLNFSSMQKQIKARIFEVCLAGGFLLTEYVPSIENYFEIGKEIVCFKNAEEMIDRIDYYLAHDKERRAIARAGWDKATKEYSNSRMLGKVFKEIEGDLAATRRQATPLKINTSRIMKEKLSDYYLNWGRALSLENYKGLWKDTLALSISYNPLNIRAWNHYIIGFLPYPIRIAIMKLGVAIAYWASKLFRFGNRK